MPNHLKSMNEIKQVHPLHFERGLPIKSISRELGMSKNTAKEYLRPTSPKAERSAGRSPAGRFQKLLGAEGFQNHRRPR
jgi:hypothetical protein